MTKTRVLKSPSQKRRRNLIFSSLLVATAIFSAWLVIERANPTQQYLVAKKGISAGSLLTQQATELVSVNLSSSSAKYLKQLPERAVYLISSVRAGEFLPLAQLASSLQDTRVPVLINPTMNLSNSIKAGSAVDIWASHSDSAQSQQEPRILALGTEVSEVFEPAGMFADSTKSIEVMVHVDDLQPVLSAIAAGDKFAAILKPTLIDQ